jgi:N-acetylneuraminic acid mutarotase
MPTPRDHHAAAALDGKLHAIGGRVDGSYARNLDAHEVYEPARNAWTARPRLPTPRSGIAAAVLGRRIFVFGGEAPAGTFGQVEAYDGDGDRWSNHAPMPTPRHGLAAVPHGGRIYVLSGGPRPGGSYSTVNEVFAP